MTRKRFPDPHLIRNIYSKVAHLGLDTKRLRRTDQKNCLKSAPASKRENEDEDQFNLDDYEYEVESPKKYESRQLKSGSGLENDRIKIAPLIQTYQSNTKYVEDDVTDGDLDLESFDSMYPDDDVFNLIDSEGPSLRSLDQNNATSASGLDTILTKLEPNGPSYWPPAK